MDLRPDDRAEKAANHGARDLLVALLGDAFGIGLLGLRGRGQGQRGRKRCGSDGRTFQNMFHRKGLLSCLVLEYAVTLPDRG
ncbi:hypothetical protein GCM10007420_16900 [Glycocaulis albus]|uniref:Uncharacterized protein n=1 Tax=Glycocaulis albus TaxID=1382801 RepID=A0ABQ1XRQ1_9PROT|nr:hypothetical protein GCM10007420_16900 [Glycocaulis albus]